MAVIGSGLPIPDVYGGKQAAAQRAFEQALIDLQSQDRDMDLQYGMRQGAGGTEIDPANQFGLAQSMLRSNSSALSQSRAALTGRGLGKSGLSRQRERLLRFLQEGDLANLGSRYTRGKQGIAGARSGAARSKDSAFNDAEMEAVMFALQNGLFNPAPADPGVVSDIDPGGPANAMAGMNAGNYTAVNNQQGLTGLMGNYSPEPSPMQMVNQGQYTATGQQGLLNTMANYGPQPKPVKKQGGGGGRNLAY